MTDDLELREGTGLEGLNRLAELRVAAVQAVSVSGDVVENVSTAVRLVRAAAGDGASLVVLPELFLSGYDIASIGRDPSRHDVAPDDPRLDPLRDAARAGAVVVAGASVPTADGGRSLALLAIDRSGATAVAYRKQHLWSDESEVFTPGTDGASLVLRDWNLGLGICYDGCFPEHARAAADAGALVYICPSAYVVGSEHRRDLYYRARAIDNGVYVVLAGLVGGCGPNEFSGGTAIIDPQGRPVATVDAGEGMAVAALDPVAVLDARAINPYVRDRPASLGGRSVTDV